MEKEGNEHEVGEEGGNSALRDPATTLLLTLKLG